MSKNTEVSNTPKAQVAHDPFEHIIENILPAREVHIFAGPSGSGKTTLLLKIVENIRQGGSVFGHQAKPTDFVYISGDRSASGMMRTMRRLKVDPNTFPLYIARGEEEVGMAISNALKKHPTAKLVVIEGFAGWMKDGKIIDYRAVSRYLLDVQTFCETRDITVWGVVHCAKVKKDERYVNPRERILGSAAWGAYAETIFYIEPEDPEDISENPIRRLMIMPRNAKEETYKFSFEDGLLVPVSPFHSSVKKSNSQMFYMWFDALDMDAAFTTADARVNTHLKETALHQELRNASNLKLIRPAGRGTWCKQADRQNADPDAKQKWQEAKDKGLVQ